MDYRVTAYLDIGPTYIDVPADSPEDALAQGSFVFACDPTDLIVEVIG